MIAGVDVNVLKRQPKLPPISISCSFRVSHIINLTRHGRTEDFGLNYFAEVPLRCLIENF